MVAAIQATCPGCKKSLRVPADWVDQAIRCKQCGMTFKAKARPSLTPLAQAAAVAPSPKEKRPAKDSATGEALPVAALLESTPPAAPGPKNKIPMALAAEPDFSDLDDDAEQSLQRRYSDRRRGVRLAALVFSFIGLLLAGVALPVALHFHNKNQNNSQAGGPESTEEESTSRTKKNALNGSLGKQIYPRRALIVSINNYLYANPVNHGVAGKVKSPLFEKLKSGLRISPDQIAELSDAAPGASARPPLKPVIQAVVEKFLKESRPQDRALIYFAGHAVEIEDQAYLVPIEGELENKDTLLPLSWIFGELAKCPARQKVLIMDVARNNPGRGIERPGSGPLGEKLEKVLQNPPAGVQVWSACVKGQYSYEFEDGSMDDGLFSHSIQKILNRGLKGVIQKPEDAYPLTALLSEVNREMKEELENFQLAQTSRLSGQEPDSKDPESSSGDPVPVTVELPKSLEEGVATRAQVATVLKELSTPPVKATQEDMVLKFETLPAFSKAVMDNYVAGGEKTELRELVEKARDLLNELATSPQMRLQEEFRAPTNDDAFKTEMRNKGKIVADLIGKLQNALDDLKNPNIVALRNRETKRWQANYDYIVARIEAQIAYLFEYASMLGRLKIALPDRDPKIHGGWRLASQAQLEGDRTGQNLAKDSAKILDKIIKNHPNTPWAVLAKRDKLTTLGLKFVPVK